MLNTKKVPLLGAACAEHGQTLVTTLREIFVASHLQEIRVLAETNKRVASWLNHIDGLSIQAQAAGRTATERRHANAPNMLRTAAASSMGTRTHKAHIWTIPQSASSHYMEYQNSLTPEQTVQIRTDGWSTRWNRDDNTVPTQLWKRGNS